MRITDFPSCCGARIFFDFFFDDGYYAADKEKRDVIVTYLNRNKGHSMQIAILNEYQESAGVGKALIVAGFSAVGPKVRNDNSGQYLQLYQRCNGKIKPVKVAKAEATTKAEPKKKSAFI